jgi:TRAP-type mannitol/chloroaromatic compound transport system substrate-binding protein
MIKRERYYDGKGNELRIDEVSNGTLKVQVNEAQIEVPLMKLFDMLKNSGDVKGKHAPKVYETR